MDLLSAKNPKGVLFLGDGGLKASEIGNFILPIAAIREGTTNDYFPPEVPTLPSFKLHKLFLKNQRIRKITELGYF